MKKICALLALVLVLSLAGCVSGEAKRFMNETEAAVAAGNYEAALKSSRLAVSAGCSKENFLKLSGILERYSSCRKALDEGDLNEAEKHFDMIVDFEGSGMADAIDALGDEIYALESEQDEIDELFESAKKAIEERLYVLAETEVQKILEKNLTEEQKKEAEEILEKAIEGQSDTGEPPANITVEQAKEFAKKALDLPDNAKVTVVQTGEYYTVNAEVDYGDFVDESGCKVSVYDGEVYDLVG